MSISNGNCNIAREDVQVAIAVLRNNLYVLKEATEEDTINN